MKPDHNLSRVHRQLAAAAGPQAVLRDRLGRFELLPASSPRVAALPADRLLGVFSPSVSWPAFVREVSA